ncbi:MAG: (2Fe-2S)-binding protein [Acidobacteria bacterium]|nr:(2Fe-2S)-binding protein [Acidobacteriota bacterium]
MPKNDDESRGRSSPQEQESGSSVSRRDFLKIGGLAAAVPVVASPRLIQVGGSEVEIHGPHAAQVTLMVNGKRLTANLEPRVTLLDALREDFNITGPKRVCDRGECGACTVLLDGKAVYSCSTLAIDAQGRQITTIEGLMQNGQLDPVQAAYVEHDASQCGFCTSGFGTATAAFLREHPTATHAEMARGLGGNFCRCGTYVGIREVVRAHAGRAAAQKGGA